VCIAATTPSVSGLRRPAREPRHRSGGSIVSLSSGPGERANAQIKSWRVLCKIRSCPSRATALVADRFDLIWPFTLTTADRPTYDFAVLEQHALGATAQPANPT
jgi:hypothetical protein